MKRNFKRNFVKNGGGGGGPIMNNDPTTNLQDLDRELELLRRKRQMLERQQQQQQGGFNRPSPWEQPPRVNEYSAPNQGFNQPQYAALYDSAPRQPAARWPEPQAKRFRPEYGATRPAARTFQPQRPQTATPSKTYHHTVGNVAGPKRPKGFKNPPPKPAAQTAPKSAPKPAAPKPAPKRDTNVPKPKTTAPPIPAYKPKQRQFNKDAPKPSRYLDFVISGNDDEPLPTAVKGRLEGVVGDLFRGLRERSGDDASLLAPDHSKYVKQVFRERIRQVLLGKAVGTPENVAALYAKAYPDTDDEEIFRLAKQLKAKSKTDREKLLMDGVEAEKNPFLQNLVATAGSPELYFMNNIEKVIELKVEEIFQKLQKVYEEDDGSVHQLIQEVDKISKEPTEKTEETASDGAAKNGSTADGAPAKDSETKDNGESGEGKPTEATHKAAEASEAQTREDYYSKLMQSLIRQELPKVLPGYKNLIIKLLNMDNNYMNAQKMLASKASSVHTLLGRKPECYVLVLGEPNLPRKEKLQVFLNKFNPASIKKHKRVRNVLYVGFSDKKDFDAIIANDGVVLADMKLYIKESKSYRDNPLKIVNGVAKLLEEKAVKQDATKQTESKLKDKGADTQTEVKTKENGASEQAKVNPADEKDSLKTSDASDDDKILFDSDLDGQITDLLSSIKKSEDITTKDSETAESMQVDEAKDGPEATNEGNGSTEPVEADNAMKDVEASDTVTEQSGATDTIAEEPQATEASTEVVEENSESNNEVDTPETANGDESKALESSEQSEEAKDSAEVTKTPTRASTRLAGGVKTRRASRLAQ